MKTFLIILSCILTITFLIVRVKIGGYAGLITKGVASLSFVAIGVYGVIYNSATANILTLLGLFMGLIGDILLDYKVIFQETQKENRFLMAGMGSFGIGHILYLFSMIILAKAMTDFSISSVMLWSVLITLILSVVVFFGTKIMKLDFGTMFIPSSVYTFIVCFASVTGIILLLQLAKADIYSEKLLMLVSGVVLILLSDLVLSTMYFGNKKNDKLLCIINHTIYYAGQILIAVAVTL